MVAAEEEQELVQKANEALAIVKHNMSQNSLELAHQKTEAVILRGKRDRTKVVFNLVGVVVVPAKNVKYLGIWIDSKMTYGEHVKKSVETANNVTAALSGVLLNVGGPGYWKKNIYTTRYSPFYCMEL